MSIKEQYAYEEALSSEENILLDEAIEEDLFRRRIRTTSRMHRFRMALTPIRIHLAFTALYLIIAALLVVRLSPEKSGYPTSKITTELVSWEKQFSDVDVGHNSPYTGPPSYDIDQAWHNLFEDANLRISGEELAALNKTSVALADGDGYMANLDIHHQLHCLKFLRWYIYPEYYDFRLNKTTTRHADHCIENLRRNIMCLPSLEVMTFDWVPNSPHPQPHFSYEHTCINWDKINEWTAERSFDYFDPALLINPIYDPSLEGEEEEG